MAARMSRARMGANHDVVVLAKDFQKEKHTDMVCYFCLCPVAGVSGGTRTVGDNKIFIDPFYRLLPSAEKKGTGHHPDCDYNVEKTVTVLVAESQAIESLNDAAQALLSRRTGKKTTLRLHILMEILRVNQEATEGTILEDAGGLFRKRSGVKYVRSGKVLDSYLKSVGGVLKLIRTVQDKPDLARWIALKYGRFEIPWSDYFFDLLEADYARLRDILFENGQITGTKTDELRPITLAIEIHEGFKPEFKYGQWELITRAQWFHDPSEERKRYSIQPILYFKEEEMAHKVAAQRYILACGLPRISERKPEPKPTLSPFSTVKMKVVSLAQVCRYRPMLG